MDKKNWLALIASIAICQAAGIIGSFFTAPAIGSWYATLAKPELAPPNWVFAPVWTTLFTLMGIAAYLVWRRNWNRKEKRLAFGIFGLQLILNVLWSVLFFGLRSPGAAFIEIVFLWLAIAATIIVFSRISRPAAWLLVPYILWVSFASYLNFSYWRLADFRLLPEPMPVVTACTMDARQCADGSYVGRSGPDCEFVCP